jgi:hypothetical protein
VAQAEDLQMVCSKLLPHKVTFDRIPDFLTPICEISQETQREGPSLPVYSQPSEAANNIPPPHEIRPPLQSTNIETLSDRDLFATYTTLVDPPLVHNVTERAATIRLETENSHVDVEMRDDAETTAASCSASPGGRTSRPTEEPNETLDSVDTNESVSRVVNATSSCSQDSTGSTLDSQRQTLQSENQSPLDNSPCVSTPACSPSHYLRAFTILNSKYSNHPEHPLRPDTITEIIKLGDSFLRVDVVSFIESFRLGWSQNGLWYRPPLTNPTYGGAIAEKLFKGFHCAEILEQGSAVDPVRLRIARIFLYHYFEQLCVDSRTNPNMLNRRSRGRDTASVVTDQILEELYTSQKGQGSQRIWKQRRDRLQKHKKIGKRWSVLASCLGIGITLVCSSSLETQT